MWVRLDKSSSFHRWLTGCILFGVVLVESSCGGSPTLGSPPNIGLTGSPGNGGVAWSVTCGPDESLGIPDDHCVLQYAASGDPEEGLVRMIFLAVPRVEHGEVERVGLGLMIVIRKRGQAVAASALANPAVNVRIDGGEPVHLAEYGDTISGDGIPYLLLWSSEGVEGLTTLLAGGREAEFSYSTTEGVVSATVSLSGFEEKWSHYVAVEWSNQMPPEGHVLSDGKPSPSAERGTE